MSAVVSELTGSFLGEELPLHHRDQEQRRRKRAIYKEFSVCQALRSAPSLHELTLTTVPGVGLSSLSSVSNLSQVTHLGSGNARKPGPRHTPSSAFSQGPEGKEFTSHR